MIALPRAALLCAAAIAAALLSVAAPARADGPPELARVEGLRPGDTLNVRAAPSLKAPIVGEIADGVGPIEILETRRMDKIDWALIGLPEANGWVSRRYLGPIEPANIGDTALHVGLRCGGTEPFWGLDIQGEESAVFLDPETGAETELVIENGLGARGRLGWPAALLVSGGGVSGVLTAHPGRCSDGMSDRDYAWTATFLERGGGAPRLFEGCCGHPAP